MVTRVLLAFSFLATAFLLWGLGSPQAAPSASSWEFSGGQQLAAPHQPQEEKEEIKDFKGTIAKAGAKFVLEESANRGNYSTYLLNDIGRSDVFPDLLLTTLALENEFVGVHENRPLVRLTRTGQTFMIYDCFALAPSTERLNSNVLHPQ
jgi:hypothetical protein